MPAPISDNLTKKSLTGWHFTKTSVLLRFTVIASGKLPFIRNSQCNQQKVQVARRKFLTRNPICRKLIASPIFKNWHPRCRQESLHCPCLQRPRLHCSTQPTESRTTRS